MVIRQDHPAPRMTPRLVIGLFIALAGLVLTFDRVHLIDGDRVLRYWPVVLVIVGALMIRQSRRVGGGVNGVIVTVIGAWLLLNTLGIVEVRFWQLFWPAVLILVGSMLVVQTVRRGSVHLPGGGDAVTIFAVLGGVNRSSSGRFRGGEVTAVLGGAHIDLRQATIAPGDEAVIDIFAVMGGCEILVPPEWTVATPIVPVLGGVEDKRTPATIAAAPDATAGVPRLVLRGLVLMGGVEIKS